MKAFKHVVSERGEQEKRSDLLEIHSHGSICQVVPLSFAATTSTLLLVLSTHSETKINQKKYIRWKRHFPNMCCACTYRLGSWSCFRVMFRFADPSVVPWVSGIAAFPLLYSSLEGCKWTIERLWVKFMPWVHFHRMFDRFQVMSAWWHQQPDLWEGKGKLQRGSSSSFPFGIAKHDTTHLLLGVYHFECCLWGWFRLSCVLLCWTIDLWDWRSCHLK